MGRHCASRKKLDRSAVTGSIQGPSRRGGFSRRRGFIFAFETFEVEGGLGSPFALKGPKPSAKEGGFEAFEGFKTQNEAKLLRLRLRSLQREDEAPFAFSFEAFEASLPSSSAFEAFEGALSQAYFLLSFLFSFFKPPKAFSFGCSFACRQAST